MGIRDVNNTVETINTWSHTWTDLVVAILWQSTVLVLVVAVVAFVLRRSSPALRFWLWQIVAIKLLLMPFWTIAISLPFFARHELAVVSTDAPITLAPIESGEIGFSVDDLPAAAVLATTPTTSIPWYEQLREFTWRSWLLVAWCIVVSLQILRLALQRVRLTRLIRRANPADDQLMQLVGDFAETLGVPRKLRVVLTELDCSPFVCGIWRPVLVLPRGVMKALDDMQLQQVLLHELAHVKRRDLLWSWIPVITRMVYFFHPIAYYVNYCVRLERELSCDQLAMSVSGANAADYANTLVTVVSHSSQPAALKAAAASSLGLDGEESKR